MKKIILTILSATFLLAANITTTEKNPETVAKSLDAMLIKKQEIRTSKIEEKLLKRELERVEKAKLREAKIQKVATKLQANANQRKEA